MDEEMPINDGKGIFDSDGLLDSLIVDCNNLTKLLIENQFVAYGNTVAEMVQKIRLLKNGIRTDHDEMQKKVDELKALMEDNHA